MNQNSAQTNAGKGRRISKRLESIISTIIVAILLIIAAGLLAKQADSDISRFGISAAIEPKQQMPQEESILIKAPAGFKKLSEAEIYTAENLYEKINGKAPLYTEAGFVKLFCQRFANQNDTNLWMEVFIYDMGGIRNAFSVYSMQKRAETTTLPGFDPMWGYLTGNGLFCVHGKNYVEIVGSAQSEQLNKAMIEVAADLQKNPTADSDRNISELALFPPESIVPGSIKLYLKNAFGFDGFLDIFPAQQKTDAQTITIFLGKRPDAANAEAMAESYRKFLLENGAKIKQTENELLKDKTFDFYGVTEIVFTTGQFIVGIHEADSQTAAEKAAMMLLKNLKAESK